jgi:hypothetical protein
MLSVHEHTARASTTNVAALGLAMFLCPYAASVSGPDGLPAITDNKPSQGLLSRLAG